MPFHEFLRQNLLFLFHIWFEAVHHLVPLTLPGRLHHGLLREPRRRLRAPAGTPNKNLKRQRWKNEMKTMRLNHFPLWNDLFYLLFSCLLLFYYSFCLFPFNYIVYYLHSCVLFLFLLSFSSLFECCEGSRSRCAAWTSAPTRQRRRATSATPAAGDGSTSVTENVDETSFSSFFKFLNIF